MKDDKLNKAIAKLYRYGFTKQKNDYVSGDCIISNKTPLEGGYVQIRSEGIAYYAHRLTCENYHGEAPEGKPFVLHSCNNRACCNPSHLRWGTAQDNANDREKYGRTAKGANAGRAKLTNSEVTKIRVMLRKPLFTQNDIANMFGVNQSTISNIKKNKNYKQ